MTRRETCPDCGAPIGQPHVNDCDVERCSVCGGQRLTCDCSGHDPMMTTWTGEWPYPRSLENVPYDQNVADDASDDNHGLDDRWPSGEGEGFVICDLEAWFSAEKQEKPKSEEAPSTPRATDDVLSRLNRKVRGHAMYEPIYEAKKPTGQYRACRKPKNWWDWGWPWAKDMPWEVELPNEEELEKWLEAVKAKPGR